MIKPTPKPQNGLPPNPRLEEYENVLLYTDDAGVMGVMEIITEDDKRRMRIYEWESPNSGLGHAGRALRWLHGRVDAIDAVGVGTIDDGVGDAATAYWERQREHGLVDQLYLDDGSLLAEPNTVATKKPKP